MERYFKALDEGNHDGDASTGVVFVPEVGTAVEGVAGEQI